MNSISLAENIKIQSKNILLDKNKNISIFRDDIVMTTEDNDVIKSDYAKYNKLTGFIELKNNIIAIDSQKNTIETDYAEYTEQTKLFKSTGPTKIITSDKYIIEGKDMILDNSKNFISSKENTTITDLDGNKIFLDNFEYYTKKNIFKSIGYIKIKDINKNSYEFSQIYIDTKKKEILGTDTKAYLNDKNLKVDSNNKPRIYANTLKINDEKSTFKKSVFTLCDYRKNDKCPPWSIQATEMKHDSKTKTIYYDNALIKVYNIPIFYLPKLSHPDPTVDRRSGFLPASFSDTKNLGAGITLPYFWDINNDKNFTITNKLYGSENPLFLGEYHQAFRNSNLLADFGYTDGYKNTSKKKKAGDKSHFFSKFVKNFNSANESSTSLSLDVQKVSNDKYLKLYKINSNLIDYNTDTLENSIDLTHEDEDIFFGFRTSIFETLNENYNDKYEYILPEITFDKNIFSSDVIGNLDFTSNYKAHNYDTNKFSNFLINNFNWNSNLINWGSGFKSKILGNLKNINYETKNIDLYKKDTTNELYGAFGYLTEIELEKDTNNSKHKLKPKVLVRYSPGSMRKENEGYRLDPTGAFSMDRLNNIKNFEAGLSSTIGFDYKIRNNNNDFDFSVAQIINEKENKKMASMTSLDEKLSDLVGTSKYQVNENIQLNYNFSVDQSYKQLNYNEFGTTLDLNPVKIDFNYLKESEHIGDQEYFKTKFDFEKSNNGLLSFETKRNLVTNSSEFYNLSYEYLNDCLRAGLVYRREFYNDSELEPENSLMFKITLTPFGNINSPSFTQ